MSAEPVECDLCETEQACTSADDLTICTDRPACQARCEEAISDPPPFSKTECAVCYSLQPCYGDGEAWVCRDRGACTRRQAENRSPQIGAALVNWSEGPPAYTITEQLEALRREAHTAQRQGLVQVVALLKERACALVGAYLSSEMCDKGHWLDERGQCPSCLAERDALNNARAQVAVNLEMRKIEAAIFDLPC